MRRRHLESHRVVHRGAAASVRRAAGSAARRGACASESVPDRSVRRAQLVEAISGERRRAAGFEPICCRPPALTSEWRGWSKRSFHHLSNSWLYGMLMHACWRGDSTAKSTVRRSSERRNDLQTAQFYGFTETAIYGYETAKRKPRTGSTCTAAHLRRKPYVPPNCRLHASTI